MVLVASWACVYDFGGDTANEWSTSTLFGHLYISSRVNSRLSNAIVIITATSVLDGDRLTAVCYEELARCQDIEKLSLECTIVCEWRLIADGYDVVAVFVVFAAGSCVAVLVEESRDA